MTKPNRRKLYRPLYSLSFLKTQTILCSIFHKADSLNKGLQNEKMLDVRLDKVHSALVSRKYDETKCKETLQTTLIYFVAHSSSRDVSFQAIA